MADLTIEQQADVTGIAHELEGSPNASVFRFIREHGGVRALVSFSGGGDSGGVEAISLVNGEGTEVATVDEAAELSDGRNAWEVMGQPVYDEYYSFAGEYYVSGTVTWDAATGDVTMDKSEHSTDEDEYNDESGDYDED